MSRRTAQWIMILVLLLAFSVRTWQIQEMPPGWRDDELINSLVISQKVLDGDFAVYYADASGHEALYHALNAGMLGLFVANAMGIRLLSVFLGVLTVALTYQVGKQFGGASVGLIASATLAMSFWSLMYSRIGLRHVLTPPLMLGAVMFFMQAWHSIGNHPDKEEKRERSAKIASGFIPTVYYAVAGLFVALGLYTYFASRGVPLIFLAILGYGAIFMWPRFKQNWQGALLMFGITAVLAIPLIQVLQNQPESEARVAELAVPLVEAELGNYEPLRHHVVVTLSMFHADGDDEWLYNIPHRPVFRGVTAVIFWLGVLIVIWEAAKPLIQRIRKQNLTLQQEKRAFNSAFLFAWWMAGISPGFISVPPASLGHTILAMPAVFILLAVPIGRVIGDWGLVTGDRGSESRFPLALASSSSLVLIPLILLTSFVAVRDWPDYFVDWSERGLVRFLYRADIRDVADYVNKNELVDFGVTGLLAGPWDKLALSIDLEHEARPRWYDPQRAVLLSPAASFSGFPDVPIAYSEAFESVDNVRAGYYAFSQTNYEQEAFAEPLCFENGFCATGAFLDEATDQLNLGWTVQRPLTLPPNPLISNPPPPGVYAGPRLAVFGQLLGENDIFLSGDDGLWVDPYTLQEGDAFVQQHWLSPPADAAPKFIIFGMYDPMTGTRILTDAGADHVRIEIE
ncbi:MAG: hypothetical protein AAF490_01875 [Chloroflexota bacterium]